MVFYYIFFDMLNYMKVAIFDTKGSDKAFFERNLSAHTVISINEPLTLASSKKATDAEVLSVFITSRLSSDILKLFPNLKLIVTRSTGFDHIDLDYCKKHKIEVTNVPFYGENTVAEHAMALLLAITRKIVPSVERTRDNSFSRDGLEGIDLEGKVIGVIGTGHIGLHLIKMASAFGMKVIAYDLYPNIERSEEYGYTYVKLDYLLSKSDVISIHVPNTKETQHMICKESIDKMKDSVVIINTSRGQAVDTIALYDALKEGKFYGVGLDVCEDEKFLENPDLAIKSEDVDVDTVQRLLVTKSLLEFDKVIMTPHNAYHSKEALKRIQQTSANNIKSYVKGSISNSVFKK